MLLRHRFKTYTAFAISGILDMLRRGIELTLLLLFHYDGAEHSICSRQFGTPYAMAARRICYQLKNRIIILFITISSDKETYMH